MERTKKVALVTGANKGIGFEITRQLARRGIAVVFGARDETRGAEAATKLRDEGLEVTNVRLDVTDFSTLEPLRRFVEERFGKLDILVNNAGVLLDEGIPFGELEIKVLRETFETNYFGFKGRFEFSDRVVGERIARRERQGQLG